VILLAALVLLLSQEVEVRRLVEQLSSDRIEARAEAFRKLEGIGRPALPLLEKAAKDPDDEVATRAKSLLVRIPIRERLTPALISGVANIYDRLALGDWRPVFLELAADLRPTGDRRRYPGVTADDLSFMAPMAVDSSTTEADRVAVCQAVGRLKLRSAIPSVTALLNDERPAVRANAIGALRDMDARDQAVAIRPFLSDSSVLVKTVAANALGRLGDKDAVPGLRTQLSDDAANVRWWAVFALAELKATEAKGAIEPLTQDPDDAVRRIAAATLKAWIK
jgi:HEAT repeat protein